jgi:type III secretion protein D
MGAEIPLTPGAVILGSSNSCDIILQDTTVAERHLCISISGDPGPGDEISIKIIDAPVILVDPKTDAGTNAGPDNNPGTDPENIGQDLKPGERLVEGEASWGPLTALVIGTTTIAWKFDGDSWGDLAASNLFSARGLAPEEEKAASPSGETVAAAQGETGKKKIVLPGLVRTLLKGAGALAIFLLVFGPCMGTKDTRLARSMAHLLEAEGFDYLTVTQTNIGVTVLGTVETQADRSHLWQMAGKVDYPVFIDIRVNEERAYAVKVALSVRGLFPEVELKEKGIIIKGYMRDKLIEGASKIWIRNDISEVSNIDSHMVYAFQVWPVLKDRLIRHTLQDFVVIRFHPGLVQVEGELNFDQRQALETVKGEVCDALDSPIAFWDTLTAPGFSAEWNASLNSGLGSRFSPDPGLAKLFLDSQSAKGVPAFFASTPGHRAGKSPTGTASLPVSSPTGHYVLEKIREKIKGAEKTTDAAGNRLAVLRDRDENVQEAVLLDNKGRIQLTPSKDPIILPVLKNKEGRILKDKKGNPVFARPVKDARDNLVFKENKSAPAGLPARDPQGNYLVDDQGRLVAGEILRNEDGTIRRDKQGNIQVKQSDGNIVAGAPTAMDSQGNVLVDDQGRVVKGEVLKNEDGTNQRDEQGNTLVRDTAGNTISARSAAMDPQGNFLVDDQGRMVAGEVLRNADGTVQRDNQGNVLVRDTDGNIIAARPATGNDRISGPMAVMAGPVRDGNNDIIRDTAGNPIMGRVAHDTDGKVVTDAGGNPVILGAALDEKGGPVRDADGGVIPLTVARNAGNEVVRDKTGNPLLVPALLDKSGRIVRDRQGRPMAPRVITGAGNRAVFDTDGNLILDQDANNVLTRKEDAANSVDPRGEDHGADPESADRDGGSEVPSVKESAASDKNVFGSGTVVADKVGQEKAEDPLGGLSIVAITLDPIPFVSMKDGQKFFTGGKLPGGYVIQTITTDQIVLKKNGKTKHFKLRWE